MTGAQGGGPTDEVAESARSILDTVPASLPRLGIALLLVAAGWGCRVWSGGCYIAAFGGARRRASPG